MEEYFGVVPCTIMSMMSNNLFPGACEVDVCGTLSMHALALASQTPSALLDWNNNYGDDPNKAVCFHCSNLPKHFFQDVRMDFQEIIAGTVGKENTFGTCVGRVKPGAMSFARFSTDDTGRGMRGYVGEGAFTNDPLNTFGGAGVVEIPRCRSCCTTSARTVLSITWRRTSRRWRVQPMKPPRVIWAGRCTGTGTRQERMAIVAGVDFGTLSVRVSLVDSKQGLLASAVSEYPLHRKRDDPEYATQSHDDHMRALATATRAGVKSAGIRASRWSRSRSTPPAPASFRWARDWSLWTITTCGAITARSRKRRRSPNWRG